MRARIRALSIAMIVSLAGCAASAGLGVGTGSALADENATAAHLCQQGGDLLLIGTDGTTDTLFTNTGQCVSYAARDGILVTLADAQPCLNNGYQNLAPEGSNTAFASEAACVLYIGQGGIPHPITNLTVTVTGNAGGGLCTVTITGTQLAPGTLIFYNGSLNGQPSQGPVVGAPAVGPDGTISASGLFFYNGFTGTISATTNTGGTVTTPINVSC